MCDETPNKVARFFVMAAKLPMELQMLLCYRKAGSAKTVIPSANSERHFVRIARDNMWAIC